MSREPSKLQIMKYGAITGGGPGPRGALYTLRQYMLTSAGSFALFLSIGAVIRSEGRMIDTNANGTNTGAIRNDQREWKRIQIEVKEKPRDQEIKKKRLLDMLTESGRMNFRNNQNKTT
ncbi:11384_t:CDS:2 [Paraglomus occultum]|uniref:11384_t:CDS:1 n=1 Tax=Paraglomus occultum TaxID=144539 RepID=A0A9N9BXC7_9GLOM|nr:11384_t:CDS:2 [Paraglomus occultum]